MATDGAELQRKKHVNFLRMSMNMLPDRYASLDQNRTTIGYFAMAGLDLLGALDDHVNRSEVIEWIYAQQILPDKDEPQVNAATVGFRGGSFLGVPYNPECAPASAFKYDQGNVAHTYTALATLLICGDDFGRVDRAAIVQGLTGLQREDGSFMVLAGDSENDMRFLYCACAVSYMLNDWSGIDVEKATAYVHQSQSYDYGFAQGPFQESHGGSTYCAVAALWLMGKLDGVPNRDGLIRWLLDKQQFGFCGRVNKKTDACYSYWVGASLKLLDAYDLVDVDTNRAFTLSCQQSIGGIGKWPTNPPDVLHTCLGLTGLAIMGQDDLADIHVGLGITNRAASGLPHVAAAAGDDAEAAAETGDGLQ